MQPLSIEGPAISSDEMSSDGMSSDELNSEETPKDMNSIELQLQHLLLPRFLPRMDYSSYNIGSGIMNQMMGTVQNLAEHLPPKSVELLEKLQLHYSYNLTPQTILQKINGLRPGDSLAIFVEHQDCAIMFRIPPNEISNNVENVIVASFPGSLNPNELYEQYDGVKVI